MIPEKSEPLDITASMCNYYCKKLREQDGGQYMGTAELSLTEFLRIKKHESERAAKSADRKLRKKQWINAVSDLYEQIEKWLKPSIDEQTVFIEKEDITLYEEHIGEYSIASMRLKIGTEVIKLIPVGTFIAGGSGRADIVLGDKSVMFIHKDDGWKILVRDPAVRYYPLDEEAFSDVIMQLMQ
jgi:hypothetical protein